jgi:hypothetical protein
MTVQEWLKVSWNMTNTKIRPWALCNDGYEISIQAFAYHYSNPRVDGASEYTEVELGFPNEPDDTILEYAEDPGMPTDTVYGFVPIDLAEELIQKHGGIIKASHFEED